jgi:hypothetical protein
VPTANHIIRKGLSDGRALRMTGGTAFRYGWCYTDTKESQGRKIRTDFRQEDYVLGTRTQGFVAHALADLGLPFPAEHEIFRGTHHDILFLDSHGVTVRIGPTIVEDLIHPGNLQPLGWVRDEDNDEMTVVIYPGIELFESALKDMEEDSRLCELYSFMERTSQDTRDMAPRNLGVIRVDDGGHTKILPVVLDTDNEMNGTNDSFARNMKIDVMRHSLSRGARPHEALAEALASVSGLTVMTIADDLLAAYGQHQPLRAAFWDAWWDGDTPRVVPDPARMAAFWRQCAAMTAAPAPCAEAGTAPLRLFTPWTGAADKPPAIERAGLSYAWDRDVMAGQAVERAGNVLLAAAPAPGTTKGRGKVIYDATLGPARGRDPGLTGVYRCEKR